MWQIDYLQPLWVFELMQYESIHGLKSSTKKCPWSMAQFNTTKSLRICPATLPLYCCKESNNLCCWELLCSLLMAFAVVGLWKDLLYSSCRFFGRKVWSHCNKAQKDRALNSFAARAEKGWFFITPTQHTQQCTGEEATALQLYSPKSAVAWQ